MVVIQNSSDLGALSCRHLQMLLRKRENRATFLRLNGVFIVVQTLEKRIGFQVKVVI